MQPISTEHISNQSVTPIEKLDVISLLKNDHAVILKLFEHYKKFAKKEDLKLKLKIAHRICSALISHTLAEEEVLYPVARKILKDDDLINEIIIEHETAKSLIVYTLLMQPDDPVFDARIKVLGEYVADYIHEEESEMFPLIAESNTFDLYKLSTEFKTRKKKLLQFICNANGEVDFKQLRSLIGIPPLH
jgi:hemerythrin superfamily protein